jgi:hypothetical protein
MTSYACSKLKGQVEQKALSLLPLSSTNVDTTKTNHGGLAVVGVPGVGLKRLDIGVKPSSFELLCLCVVSGSSSYVLYRVATFVDLLYTFGDINIHFECDNESASRQFVELLGVCSLVGRVSLPTHILGGILDVVATREDLLAPIVDVINIGLSDHHVLRWSSTLARQPPAYTYVARRSWRQLNIDAFRAGLQSSQLCCSDAWSQLDVDSLALLYGTEITAILNEHVPVKTVACRRRPSDPWFDDECRAAKRSVRQLERAARRADPTVVLAATAEWYAARRAYRTLLRWNKIYILASHDRL